MEFEDELNGSEVFIGDPNDGLIIITDGPDVLTAADAEREVQAFYHDSAWRVIEDCWVGPVRTPSSTDIEWVESTPGDEESRPAWRLVHTGAETIPYEIEWFPNPHFGVERADRRKHAEWKRERERENEPVEEPPNYDDVPDEVLVDWWCRLDGWADIGARPDLYGPVWRSLSPEAYRVLLAYREDMPAVSDNRRPPRDESFALTSGVRQELAEAVERVFELYYALVEWGWGLDEQDESPGEPGRPRRPRWRYYV